MSVVAEAAGITKRFSGSAAPALDDVSLGVRRGEFLTLLGPSGCGKTTLLRLFSGFEFPDAGRILLDGVDVTTVPPYRRNVNQVFQSYALFPHLSVRDNVAFGLLMRRLQRSVVATKVAAALQTVSLLGFEDRKPHQLSGGQRQRVALARALVCEPQLLLLDEPLAALDAQLRHSMQLELKRLQSRVGITFVFVTHDQEEALAMSDRIAVMTAGQIVQIGPAAEVYHRPRTAFVASFLGNANILRREALLPHVALQDAAQFFAVRPERIRLQHQPAEPGGAQFTLPATVIDTIFRGISHQVVLRTAAGLELTALVPGEIGSQWIPGSAAYCAVGTADLIPLDS